VLLVVVLLAVVVRRAVAWESWQHYWAMRHETKVLGAAALVAAWKMLLQWKVQLAEMPLLT